MITENRHLVDLLIFGEYDILTVMTKKHLFVRALSQIILKFLFLNVFHTHFMYHTHVCINFV